MSNKEHRVQPRDPKGMRTGYTTGSVATAAAKAALRVLITQQPVDSVEITLPVGEKVTFKVEECQFIPKKATCGVIKDAGDDPDVTHGAEICATVSFSERPGIQLDGGMGVGRITKSGLGLEIDEAAINPVPRRMIRQAIEEELLAQNIDNGVKVVIWVPHGEELAQKTLNPRLGIIGGISILGTTGIVKPYSTKAFRESITKYIEVAVANGCDQIILTTGGKSEKFAQALYPDLKEEAFIQMGDFVGFSLKEAVRLGIRKATICGMIGKLAKMAQGRMQTHAAGAEVDMEFLASLVQEIGAPDPVLEEIKQANTARHVSEILEANGITGFYQKICEKVREVTLNHVRSQLEIEVILTDFDGNVLGRVG